MEPFLTDQAQRLDEQDPLREFRHQFCVPHTPEGREVCYLVGNSLGLMPRQTPDFVQAELDAWRHDAVAAHFSGSHPWMPYHEFLTEPMAALVGAAPHEVVMMNSLTTNLHLALASLYRPTSQRHQILIEAHAFPSDHYAVESQLRWHGRDPQSSLVLARPDAETGLFDMGRLLEQIEQHRDSLAVIMLPGVQYYTGQVFPMAEIVRTAHQWGILVGFDLAHAAGNLQLQLHDWNVDFAVWCTYKYLNSGPGSVGGFYLHERWACDPTLLRLSGWWGHDKRTRFQMGDQFHPIPTAEGWQLSNPPILSLAAIRSSLDVFQRAGGMAPLVAKSRQLTGYFRDRLEQVLGPRVAIVTPPGGGCQLSLQIRRRSGIKDAALAKQVKLQLDAVGIETDWREPDVIRAAPVPLYNQFADVDYFVAQLQAIMERLDA